MGRRTRSPCEGGGDYFGRQPRKSGLAVEDAGAHVDRDFPARFFLLPDRAIGVSDFALTLTAGEMGSFGGRVADRAFQAPFAQLVDREGRGVRGGWRGRKSEDDQSVFHEVAFRS